MLKRTKALAIPLKKERAKERKHFESVEAAYIPMIRETEEFQNYSNDIKKSFTTIKILRDGLNEKLSLEK